MKIWELEFRIWNLQLKPVEFTEPEILCILTIFQFPNPKSQNPNSKSQIPN